MRFSGQQVGAGAVTANYLGSVMCGRSTLHDAPTNVLERFSLPPVLPGFVPRYNIAPSQQQWTVSRDRNGAAVARQMKWGLVPSWAKDPSIGNRMINARAESLAEKPSWRDSLRTQRCIILADGYYEWRTAGKEKTPLYFHLADGRGFGLAGLWDRWYGGESPLETCTVITTAAGSRTSPYHHRMPVVLTEDAAVAWLETSARERDLLSLLTAYESDDLEVYEVTRHVNNPANEDAECIRPADWNTSQV
jgi:putative SOS response-associated peptidase YedK